MKFSSFVLAAAAAVYASAQEVTRCGSPAPPSYLVTPLNQTGVQFSLLKQSSRSVDTYAHIVTTRQKQGAYTQADVDKQIATMNSAYAPSGFSFNLLDTSFTVNDDWASAGQSTAAELEMKTELRQGSYDTLNLYFLSDLGGGLLGFCYFPEQDPSAQDKILDGCVNLAGSMTGVGEYPDYDLGYTTVHETGHWLGLFHVFQGNSCTGSGDYISDTPAQSSATQGCPATKDSCPGQPGADSISNFMDYSYDECLDSFTAKQGARMFAVYDQYRAGK
ncbi:uncharacterized protein LTR77_000042 [Saxophila tyrrhenica]|uniref:Peptidase M43 pregnancy-associated plasma-A domain-containing protein n=1 Tax=Saxophila tyrrhenica TaxID=1690608 RepID=A0AAV9PMI6_9PEZI|nr:hypothetical protein LTR77_000042 [Saxophila tyrrhenica]